MTDKLKPCPFCGPAIPVSKWMKHWGKPGTVEHTSAWVVSCSMGHWALIKDWQTRPMEDALLEACDKALHELGVPSPGYPAPVTNAVVLLHAAIARAKGEA